MFVDQKIDQLAAAIAREGEATRERIVTEQAETRRGLRVNGASSHTFRANHLIYHAGRRLLGWSLRAEGGPVVITFRDGRNAEADPIGAVCLADGQSETVTAMPVGVAFAEGLFAEVTGAGAVVGAVWTGTVD